MKVTLKECNEDKYPCIKQLKDANSLVIGLFECANSYTVLYSENSGLHVGHRCSTFNSNAWIKYSGILTLQNN